MGKLNTAKLRSLTTPAAYGDGGGLYLQVRNAARRSWIFRFKRSGRGHLMGLGAFPDVGLAEAREAAEGARELVREGTDPIEHRRAVKAAGALAGLSTFREVGETYIAAHEKSWRNAKHRQQWKNTLATYADPVLGRLSVAVVDTGAVMRVLEPIWQKKSETAARVRGRIEAVLDYATALGWRRGENPARWRGHLANLLPARSKIARVEHHAALPWHAMGTFMGELHAQSGVAALALRFTVLTAARTGETIGARWSEIHLADAVWIVPGERMKAGREHRVPLSKAALAVLREAAKLGTDPAGFVFPGARQGKPLSNMAMAMLLKRMDHGDVTVHGFRSTFRDWSAEATNHARELAEAALAHTLESKVEAAYQRGDLLEKRRQLMTAWAAFCARPPAARKVVAIRA